MLDDERRSDESCEWRAWGWRFGLGTRDAAEADNDDDRVNERAGGAPPCGGGGKAIMAAGPPLAGIVIAVWGLSLVRLLLPLPPVRGLMVKGAPEAPMCCCRKAEDNGPMSLTMEWRRSPLPA